MFRVQPALYEKRHVLCLGGASLQPTSELKRADLQSQRGQRDRRSPRVSLQRASMAAALLSHVTVHVLNLGRRRAFAVATHSAECLQGSRHFRFHLESPSLNSIFWAHRMTSNVLPLFWNLSSNDSAHRLDAAEQLVGALDGFQRAHVEAAAAAGKADAPAYEAGGQDKVQQWDAAFEARNSEDVKYSVKRLVRGLASSRDSSRLGFAVALTEVGGACAETSRRS